MMSKRYSLLQSLQKERERERCLVQSNLREMEEALVTNEAQLLHASEQRDKVILLQFQMLKNNSISIACLKKRDVIYLY